MLCKHGFLQHVYDRLKVPMHTMSEMQRLIFQSKLLEAEKAIGFKYDEEEEETNSPDELPPLPSETRVADAPFPAVQVPSSNSRSREMKGREMKPALKWLDLFENNSTFESADCQFNVYYTLPKSAEAPLFIFHHGAGSSGLTFGYLCKALTNYMKKDGVAPGFLVFDARGHGSTVLANLDFSKDTLVKDAVFVVDEYLKLDPLFADLTKELPPIILVGHSLGGAVLTDALTYLKPQNIFKGLVMLDIVEETAVRSLGHMNNFLKSRPKSFDSVRRAIDWHLSNNYLSNRESASVSVPALLRPDQGVYKWRTDLASTAPYWDTWFTGLSEGFVNAPVDSKLLILAGNDSLDKNLMIGQMQGKFQLIVFLESGHFLHEDVPNKTAISLVDFWQRNFHIKKKEIPILWGTLR